MILVQKEGEGGQMMIKKYPLDELLALNPAPDEMMSGAGDDDLEAELQRTVGD